MTALSTSCPAGSSKGWKTFCMARRKPSRATRRASSCLTSSRQPVRICRLSSVAMANTTRAIISFNLFCGILMVTPLSTSAISGYSMGFMPARLLLEDMQRMEAEWFSLTLTVTLPPGSLRTSSVRSLPGRTTRPGSFTSAVRTLSMVRLPSEQVRLIPSSEASTSTPSRICLAGRAASARVTVFSPSRRSWAFIVNCMGSSSLSVR